MLWDKITGFDLTNSIFNEQVYSIKGEVSSRVVFIYILLTSFASFIIVSVNHYRKSGDIKGAIILIICLGFGLFGLLIDMVLLILKIRQLLFIDEWGYVGFAVLIGYKNYRNILDAGKIKKDLESSENQLKQILASAEEAIWDWHTELDKIYINKKFEELFCVENKLVISKDTFLKCIHKKDRGRISEYLDKVKSNTINSFTDEFRVINSDGDDRWVFIKANVAEYSKTDLVKRVVGFCLDISENKIQAHLLTQSETRFKEIFDNSSVGMYRSKSDGKFLMANPAFLNIFGLTSIDGLNGDDLYHEGERERFLSEIAGNDFLKGVEFQCKHSNKSQLFIRESSRVVRNTNGEIQYYEGIIEDITEQKNYEKALSDKAFTYRQLFDLSPAGIVVQDETGLLIDVNQSYCNSMGYSREEIVGYDIKKFVDPKHHEKVDQNRNKILSGETLIHIVQNVHKNGSIRYFGLYETSIPLANNKRGVLVICNDITDRKIYEEELVNAKLKAEAADNLKSEFLAQISHEIRTPINTILSFVSLIEAEIFDDMTEEVQESFSIIDSAGRRITRTVNLILDMSQIQSGSFECKFREYDLYEDVLYKIFQEYKKTAKNKKLNLSVKKETENTLHTFDEYTVSQIFQNLIDNAIKYTHEGSIELKIGRNNEGNIFVSVNDSGIGISEDYLPNMFTPFRQEEQGYTRSYDGNGLGLALVKQYCAMNNIDIIVNSEKGVGTEFILSFLKNNKS